MTTLYHITDTLAIMPKPQSGELLRGEIEALRNAGVDVLVSLLGNDEIPMLGLDKEEAICIANDITFLHFPVKDFSVPADMDQARMLVEKLHAFSGEGKKIVIHCRGGIGRSSLMASALLMRGGNTPAECIEKISNSRGHTVPETAEQRAWIENFHATLHAHKPSSER